MSYRIKFTLPDGHINLSKSFFINESDAIKFCEWYNAKGAGITAEYVEWDGKQTSEVSA